MIHILVHVNALVSFVRVWHGALHANHLRTANFRKFSLLLLWNGIQNTDIEVKSYELTFFMVST